MSLTNPDNVVSVERLSYFEGKLQGKYATKEEAGVDFATVAESTAAANELT